MLVVDASVIIKLFVPETLSAAAIAACGGSDRLLAPAHAFAEVDEVLARKLRSAQVTDEQLNDVYLALPKNFEAVGLEELLRPAIQLAHETSARVYDALYLALADSEQCRLVTADRRLIEKMAPTRYAALLLALDSFTGPP